MKFLKTFIAVFKTYDYRDGIISLLAMAVFMLMIVKMIFFPYGFFNFGSSDIYTEGLVSKNGIQNLNPVFVQYNEADREISSLIFSGLMKYNPEKKAIVDDMATLAISEDKKEYVFTLKKGLLWHDGAPITADDVYFTFHDVIMADGFPNQILRANFEGVAVEKVDDKTIKFKLEKPNIFFVTNLTTGILPKHLLQEVGAIGLLQSDFNKNPVGSGPYRVDEPVQSSADGRSQVTLTVNENYYGKKSEVVHMRFFVYPSAEALYAEIGAMNGVVKVSGEYIEKFKENPRFELLQYELPQYTAVFLNMDSPILSASPNVRLALLKAVDKDALMKLFVDKVRVDTPLMDLKQEDWVYQASEEQAQGALKDAGYTYAADDVDKKGVRFDAEKKALQLNLIARAYDKGTPQFDEVNKVVGFLQDSWEKIGFDIKVEFLDRETFETRIMERKYDLLFVGQNLGYNLDTYSYWHSTQASQNGQNLSNYKSFAVDSLIEDIRSVFDLEKRDRELTALAEQIKKDVPAIFLYRPVYYYAMDTKIEGVKVKNVVFPNDRFSNVAEWKFKK